MSDRPVRRRPRLVRWLLAAGAGIALALLIAPTGDRLVAVTYACTVIICGWGTLKVRRMLRGQPAALLDREPTPVGLAAALRRSLGSGRRDAVEHRRRDDPSPSDPAGTDRRLYLPAEFATLRRELSLSLSSRRYAHDVLRRRLARIIGQSTGRAGQESFETARAVLVNAGIDPPPEPNDDGWTVRRMLRRYRLTERWVADEVSIAQLSVVVERIEAELVSGGDPR